MPHGSSPAIGKEQALGPSSCQGKQPPAASTRQQAGCACVVCVLGMFGACVHAYMCVGVCACMAVRCLCVYELCVGMHGGSDRTKRAVSHLHLGVKWGLRQPQRPTETRKSPGSPAAQGDGMDTKQAGDRKSKARQDVLGVYQGCSSGRGPRTEFTAPESGPPPTRAPPRAGARSPPRGHSEPM